MGLLSLYVYSAHRINLRIIKKKNSDAWQEWPLLSRKNSAYPSEIYISSSASLNFFVESNVVVMSQKNNLIDKNSKLLCPEGYDRTVQ